MVQKLKTADAVRTAAVRMRIMMQQRMQYSRMKQDRIYPDRGEDASDKSKMVTFLLALFSGPLGLHNFYTGRWGRALFYMVTMGFLMFGWLYDLFMIATNKFKDANGDYIVR